MTRLTIALLAACSLAACDVAPSNQQANGQADAAPATQAALSLTRLDCGTIQVKDFNKSFSDRGLYEPGPKQLTDSCYLIRHGDQLMIWDTGLSAELKGTSHDAGDFVMSLDKTIAEQLAKLAIRPEAIDVVGISHHHNDHTGQLAAFPNARLVIGAEDFERAKALPPEGGPSPIAPWLGDGGKVTRASADVDIFGDGSVMALHLPGHTPNHLALLVRLKSGPVLLSGDLYHATEARELRGVPPFNTDRQQTLDSMMRFENLAKELEAKVIIQHEADDIGKLPAFPKAAE